MLEVLLTANSAGDLAYLARLYTALRQIKANSVGKLLLIDVGRAWSSEVWICQATENRAPYIVLDAMGYDFIFADGLSPTEFMRLEEQLITGLLTAEDQTAYALEDHDIYLQRNLGTAEAYLVGDVLQLPLPPKGSIYHLWLENSAGEGVTLIKTAVHRLSAATLPDPTIAGTVEFVIDEARYYQKKGG